MNRSIRLEAAVAWTWLLSATGVAVAQETPPAAPDVAAQEAVAPEPAPLIEGEAPVETVVITGSRLREESAQQTPIAVSVLSAQAVENTRGVDISALSSIVPNLTIEPVGSSPGVAAISLRGFNTRTSDIAPEPGVAVYVDGVYQVINSGQLADLYDIERLEVLRGPQGTLLGKNAGAGAVLLTRSRPTGEFGVKTELEYGTDDLIRVRGLLNFPIVQDKLAAKVFASYREREPWVDNLQVPGGDLAGEEFTTVRAALLYTPTDTFDLYLTADALRDNSDQHPGRNVSGPNTAGCLAFGVCGPHIGQRNVTNATRLDGTNTDEDNYTAVANLELGGVKLTSITGYRTYEQENNVDLDSVPELIIQVFGQLTELEQFSQELRLSSLDGGGLDMDGRLAWLVAGYYGDSNADHTLPFTAFGADSTQSEEIKRESYALFGHADYDLTDLLTLQLGARHSWDETDHRFALRQPGTGPVPLPFEESDDWQNNSYEGGLQYQYASDKMFYFRYAEGFRGGGFVGLPGSLEAARSFAPETSESYELGAKTEWLDGRVLMNLTLFDVQFKDMQRDIVLAGPNNTFIQSTANAADATTRGVELESILRATDDFTVQLNIGYLDAKYDSYVSLDPQTGQELDLSGDPLTYAPEWTGSLTLDYEMGLGDGFLGFDTMNFHANADYRSEYTTSATNNPVGEQGGFTLFDAAVTLDAGGRYSLTVYGENLGDKEYTVLGEDVSNLIFHALDNFGRAIGVVLRFDF